MVSVKSIFHFPQVLRFLKWSFVERLFRSHGKDGSSAAVAGTHKQLGEEPLIPTLDLQLFN